MARREWFVVRDGKEIGPYSPAELKRMAATGKVQPDDKLRRSDMKAATKASTIKGLFTTSPPSATESPSSSTGAAPPPADQKTAGASKKTVITVSAVAGACLLLCCGGLGVVAILAPKKPDAMKKEVADGGASPDKGSRVQADQQKGKPTGPPQAVKIIKGGNREPLELRVLATDEIEIVTPAPRTVTGFSLYFDLRWKKPVDKDNPSWPWRYTIFNKNGERIGEGEVGTRDKIHRPYDAETQSGQRVMSWIALNRDNFEEAALIDIHRGDIGPVKDAPSPTKPKPGTEGQPSNSGAGERWTGGTLAEFISAMRKLSREEFPRIDWLVFDPDRGKAKSLTRNETTFAKRFGQPSQNVVDSKKAEQLKASNRDSFRLWVYECRDGTITLHISPTHVQITSGNLVEVLSITLEPADCVRKTK